MAQIGSLDIDWADAHSDHPASAAVQFLKGRVTSERVPTNAVMYDVAFALIRFGEDLTDEICASAALYLAEVEVKPARFTKDGFAYGIARKPPGGTPVVINGQRYYMPIVDVDAAPARRKPACRRCSKAPMKGRTCCPKHVAEKRAELKRQYGITSVGVLKEG